MARKKPLVTKNEVNEAQNLQYAQIVEAVNNQEAVANFLRVLADQTAADPAVHSEIVKSATLLRVFLENQTANARVKWAEAFKQRENKDAIKA